jgi:hypothetical protein
MTEREDIEKVRQEIMRFRELLNIMAQQLQTGERAYASLFSKCSDEDVESLRDKDLQWKVAQQIIEVNDLAPLRKAVMHMRYNARTMERDFEELYDLIATTSATDGLTE